MSELFNPINSFVEKIIKKEDLSPSEVKIAYILLLAPIIGDNKDFDINRINDSFDKRNVNIDKDDESQKGKLTFTYTYQGKNESKENRIELGEKKIYNIKKLEGELYPSRLKKKLSKIDFIKFVKIHKKTISIRIIKLIGNLIKNY